MTVSVGHPYWYSMENSEVDGLSEAIYAVTKDETRRVGDGDVDPC